MFEKNILTFNPGWDQDVNTLEEFDDVREIQKELKSKGIEIENEADESSSGPDSFVVIDPDGNPILIDQHIWRFIWDPIIRTKHRIRLHQGAGVHSPNSK